MGIKKAEWDATMAKNPGYKKDFFVKTIVCLVALVAISVFSINSTTPSCLRGGIAYGCLTLI